MLLATLLCIRCGKNTTEYTLEGQLMTGCGAPAANKKMDLYQDAITLTSVGGYLKTFQSDENGYFKVTYNPENAGKLSIRSNGILLEGIPSRKNIDIGDVYYNPPPVNFTIRLQVNKSYTSGDTLYYYDWNYPQNGANHWVKKIPGPFQSGVIDSVLNAGYMSFPFTYNVAPFIKINYYINTYDPNQNAFVTVSPCSGSFSEAVFSID